MFKIKYREFFDIRLIIRHIRLPLLNSITVAVLLLPLIACNNFGTLSDNPAPMFLSGPAIELDPNLNTPLAGLLTLTTDQPVRVSLEIALETEADNKKWRIDFDQFDTEHSLPVLGFRPNKKYSVIVHVFSQTDKQTSFKQPITVITDPLPDGFPEIHVESTPELMEPGLTLIEIIPEGSNAEFGALLVIVDETGEIVWYQTGSRFTDVRQTPEGNLLFIVGNKIFEMDMLGNTVREWRAVRPSSKQRIEGTIATATFHHEVFPMTNGHYLVMSAEPRSFDHYPTSETDKSAPTETARVVGDVIVEFTADGSIVKQWSLLDMLDPYRIGFGALGSHWDGTFKGKKTRDWSHGNAVIHDPGDDTIIVSLRHQDATIKFDRQTGQLIWILGPHENWDLKKFGKYLLTPVSDQKIELAYFFPYHQHAPEIMPNGNIMIYDNGSYGANPFHAKPRRTKVFSRAVEYKINEETMEVEIAWEYGSDAARKIYSGALGDADYLPQTGNVLITHGNLEAKDKKQSAVILEVTHTTPAREVFKMTVVDGSEDPENGWRVYRSERLHSLYPK